MIEENLIASCGMNCALCVAYLRDKDKCPGCKNGPIKISCLNCKIRNCSERKGEYCFDCTKFPCDRLKKLDKRYRERYGMSEIENLELIRDSGMEALLKSERRQWQRDDKIFCVHNKKYYKLINHAEKT